MADFDPYHRWLGIPATEQPPNYYRLLGLVELESDEEVIQDAADRQTSHIKRYATGPHRDIANDMLNELATAHLTLLDPVARKEYDRPIKRRRKKEAEAKRREKQEEQKRLQDDANEKREKEERKRKKLEAKKKAAADERDRQSRKQLQQEQQELEKKLAAAEAANSSPIHSFQDEEVVDAFADDSKKTSLLVPLLIAGVVGVTVVVGTVLLWPTSEGSPPKFADHSANSQPGETNKPNDLAGTPEIDSPDDEVMTDKRVVPESRPITINEIAEQEIPELALHKLKIVASRSLEPGEVFELDAEAKVPGVSLSENGTLTWVPTEQQSDVNYEIVVAIKKDTTILASTKIRYFVKEVVVPSTIFGSVDEFSLFAGESKTEYLMFLHPDSKFEDLEVSAPNNVSVDLRVAQEDVPDEIQKSLSAKFLRSSANATKEDTTLLELVFGVATEAKLSADQITITDKKTNTQFQFPISITQPFKKVGQHDSFVSEVFVNRNQLGVFSADGIFSYWKDDQPVAKFEAPPDLYAKSNQLRRWSFAGQDNMNVVDDQIIVWSPEGPKSTKYAVNTQTDSFGKLVDQKFNIQSFKEKAFDWNSQHDYLINGAKISYAGSVKGIKKAKAAPDFIRFVDGTMTTFTADGRLSIWSGFEISAKNRKNKFSHNAIVLPGAKEIGRIKKSGDFYCCFGGKIERSTQKSQWRSLSIFEIGSRVELRKELPAMPHIHDANFWNGFLVVARKEPKLQFVDLESFEMVHEMNVPAPVTAIAVGSVSGQLIVGDESGSIIRFADGLDGLIKSKD